LNNRRRKMKGTKKVILAVIMTVALLIGMQSASHAAIPTPIELSLFDPDPSDLNPLVVVADGDPLDSNPVVGAVTFNGSIGKWTVNVTTGVTYPAYGTKGSPKLDLNSVNVSSNGAATLFLGVSALDYTLAPGGAIFQIGGTTNGFVSAEAFSGVDAYFDPSSSLGGPMTFSFGAFSGSVNGAVPSSPNPYSLTILAEIDHGSAGGSSSFNANLAVPEPTTLLFLGFGLVGLVRVRRKFLE
jgi:hypothetical protein